MNTTAPRRPGFDDLLKALVFFFLEWIASLVISVALGAGAGMALGSSTGLAVGGGLHAIGTIVVFVRFWQRAFRLRAAGMEHWGLKLLAVFAISGLPLLGVLGILGAVAIPNFHRYQGQPRQSEAKVALAAIYGGEMAFRAEFNKFVYDLKPIAYEGQERRLYAVGFPTACVEKYGGQVAYLPTANSTFEEARGAEIENFFREVVKDPASCKDPSEGFEAYAVGLISKGGKLDVWRIDEQKKLENLSSGILR